MNLRIAFLLGTLLLVAVHATAAETLQLRLPAIFSDHMVVQRNAPIAVWGWAGPGKQVTATLAKSKATAAAGEDGKWQLKLEPLPAGGPHELRLESEDHVVVFSDVLVGDVWLCGGQSNMEWPVRSSDNAEKTTSTANYPRIRLFEVKHHVSTRPLDDLTSYVSWRAATPESVTDFSAVGYFFGRNLHQHLDVPIGLIESCWGGSPAEAWMSYEGLTKLADFRETAEEIREEPVDPDEAQAHFEKKLERWRRGLNEADKGHGNTTPPRYADPKHDDDTWKTMELPQHFDATVAPGHDGVVWFRKEVTVPAAMAGKPLRLSLGPIDDSDETWFNGTRVGGTEGVSAQRRYRIAQNLVQPGRNVIAVRVLDYQGPGGFHGKPGQMFLETSATESATTISLAGEWKFELGTKVSELPPRPPRTTHRSMVMHNAMIAPLVPYTLTGAIWYQGESNAGRARQYRELFPAMIADWRRVWGMGDFPFLYVQLANFSNYMEPKTDPADDTWAELREAQLMTLKVPNTAMATAVDIGDTQDIHPRNKEEVGRRLALAARALVYRDDVVHSGPIYRAMEKRNGSIILSFDSIGGGLKAKDGEPLKGFAIAGADRKFVWAEADIVGNNVVVKSDKVKKPVAVRYAWAADPDISLYNREGLPASPFRTDDWPGITDNDHFPSRRN